MVNNQWRLEDNFAYKKSDRNRRQRGDHAREHEAVVQNILADARRASLVKRNCGQQRGIRWQKEVAVNGWKDRNERGSTQPERNAHGHKGNDGRSLAGEQDRERKESYGENPRVLLNRSRNAVDDGETIAFK